MLDLLLYLMLMVLLTMLLVLFVMLVFVIVEPLYLKKLKYKKYNIVATVVEKKHNDSHTSTHLLPVVAGNSVLLCYCKRAGLIVFRMNGKQVKFILPLPQRDEFKLTETGRTRTENSQYEAWEKACRQRWRALKLVIQAKLEAVECGISVFEDEFLSNIMLPDGQTVGDFMRPQINQVYISGKMPPMLPMLEV